MPADAAMEMFQLVDRDGNRVGQASRAACHGNPALIHLVVHLHVFDPRGRLCLQKRSMTKDTNPGRWDTSVGGHVGAGEEVMDALLREAREELGIDARDASFLYAWLSEGSFESELAHCYRLVSEQVIHPDPAEIDEGRYFTLDEVRGMMGTGVLTPMFEREWPMLMAAIAGQA
jgi:isopentenyl-diphosphate delta-isomerase type 1